jgi:Flp pilus assembly protein TadG
MACFNMLWLKKLNHLFMVFRHRRAGVALIVAMSTPLLIAITGLSVDVGYWYQQQENLQSAVDSAALAAAQNYPTTPSTLSTIAVSAANTASNGQFGLTSTTLTLNQGTTQTVTGASSVTATTKFTVTGKIPRGGFFSKVTGLGLVSLAAGYQYASATAVSQTVTPSAPCNLCIQAGGGSDKNTSQNGVSLSASGGATVTSASGSLYVGSTLCSSSNNQQNAIVANPSAHITFSNISTPGCYYADTNGGAYIGNSSGSTSGDLDYAPSQTDPLISMGEPPPWPGQPTTPTAPTGTTYTAAPSLGYNTYSGPPGDCIYMGTYTANCELPQGAYSGMNNLGLSSLVLNENTSSGTTYITGGFSINANNFLTLNGSTYYIINGMSLTDGGTANIYASNLYIKGGTTLQNGKVNLGVNNTSNTYYFTGPYVGYSTGWGLDVNLPTVNFGPGTYYVDGGIEFPGSNPVASLGQGTYLFTAYTNTSSGNQNTNSGENTSGGALNDNNANITFTGGTYYFNGGLTLQGNATAYFGPGIYYIKNGDLFFAAGSHVTANGATFVLEGNASYQMDGGYVGTNLTAPTTNCIQPSNYPVSTYSLPSSSTTLPNAYAPYDGTNAEGICGVLIYQQRSDTTADNIIEGATTTITGTIYAPSANLTISGGASIASTVSGGVSQGLSFIINSLSVTGSGSLTVSNGPGAASGGSGGTNNAGTGTPVTTALLIN